MPIEVFLEPTNYCNIHCTMCPNDRLSRQKGFMDYDIFRNIIKQIKQYSEVVTLHALGEPMMHPRIFEMIEYCKENGLVVMLSTNATLLTVEKAKMFIRSGVDYLTFALDAATKETYERIRKGAKYEKVLKNIENFMIEKKKTKSNVFVALQLVALEENKEEINDFIRQWKGNKQVNIIRIKPEANITSGELKDNVPSTPCIQVWRNLNINCDGSVVPCCFDNDNKYVMGNVAEQSINDIWNSQRFRDFRKKQSMREIDICYRCDFGQPNKLSLLAITLLNGRRVKQILPIIEKIAMKSEILRRSFYR